VLGGSASANHSAGRKSEGVTFATVVQQSEQRQQQGATTRQLLWEVLKQLKPAACHWYEAGAGHHQQQQGGASAAPASVPECTSPALWSTLTRSLASDLLLVPPSIRDLVGNGWAAGAGRLGGDSGSSVAGVAARMLAVQYARAATRQYEQVSRVEPRILVCSPVQEWKILERCPISAGKSWERRDRAGNHPIQEPGIPAIFEPRKGPSLLVGLMFVGSHTTQRPGRLFVLMAVLYNLGVTVFRVCHCTGFTQNKARTLQSMTKALVCAHRD
jgi:hypothetical protein